jgi:transcription antitermination factor NusG
VLSTPGVFRLLAFGNQLATVDASEMDNIRRAVSPGIELQPWPFLAVGDLVEIAEGPLTGLVGRLISARGECRLILGISLLQRSLSVTMDRRWVPPHRTPAPAPATVPSSVAAAPRDTAAVLLAA